MFSRYTNVLFETNLNITLFTETFPQILPKLYVGVSIKL